METAGLSGKGKASLLARVALVVSCDATKPNSLLGGGGTTVYGRDGGGLLTTRRPPVFDCEVDKVQMSSLSGVFVTVHTLLLLLLHTNKKAL